VYHAAAYKHVPLVEHNPSEGLQNNVLGTLNLAQAAKKHHTTNFVLISTDKAVRPTNVMGATKRFAELVLQALANEENSGTCFSMVRFGNVLGSSGSVVPLFREQIRSGGPVTLTHAEVTRYFMTIPEAAQLVIQAGAMAKGGEVFVLDMGQPVKIYDLAKRMVELSGLSVKNPQTGAGDIEIVVTGLRPGEKLYEELLIGEDPTSTTHPRIMMAREDFLPWEALTAELALLQEGLSKDDFQVLVGQLQRLVNGYQPSGNYKP
jgi:FlaA1/EpsC-like NDP-sugar epimerase